MRHKAGRMFTYTGLFTFVAALVYGTAEEPHAAEPGAKPHWTYGDQSSWGSEFPECTGLKLRQSPIDIETNKVIHKNMSIEFINWDQDVDLDLKNTHHSISVIPQSPDDKKPSVVLSWLPDGLVFELQEMHFHWGDGVKKGSEHEINNDRAAAEMHMVHYQKGVTKDQLGSVDNSVVVIGVMIESDEPQQNSLDSLVSRAAYVNGTDNEYKSDNPENLIYMLPQHVESFYTYNGSLTTPPCYEVVTWIVMSQPVYMDNDKLMELSNIEAANTSGVAQKINANHRDVQPLLDRPVYASFNPADSITPPPETSRFTAAFEDFASEFGGVETKIEGAFESVENAGGSLVSTIESTGSSFMSWL